MISIRRSPTSHPAEKQNAKREASALTDNRCFRPRACLKNHFRKLGLAAHEKPFSDTL
jgi:hypothetical protein